MISIEPHDRTLAKRIISLATFVLLPTLCLSFGLAIGFGPSAPSAVPTTAPSLDGRTLFLPLSETEREYASLPSRGGSLLFEEETTPTPIPTQDTVESEPTLAVIELNPSPTGAIQPPTPTDIQPEPTPDLSQGYNPHPTDAAPDYKADSTYLYVTANSLNLRDGPSVDCTLVRKLAFAEKVLRIIVGPEWSKVVTAKGETGYVKSSYLSLKAPAPKVSASTLLRQRIVALAKKQLGIHYVHYAASPSTGFDCSGLTWYVYKQVGILIPRSASAYASAGKTVKLSQVLPGDILCWDTRDDGITSVTHVGIYIGNGMMIHASSTNNAVKTQNVKEYSERFLYVKRFIS
jgi:cell wall-associated NlpC family hydrolase